MNFDDFRNLYSGLILYLLLFIKNCFTLLFLENMMLGNLKLGMQYLFMSFIRGLKKQILSVSAYFFTTGQC